MFKLIPVTATVFAVIFAVAVFPLFVFAVIVAVPAAFAVTNPLVDTVATLVLELVHVTVLLVALDGVIVAVNCDVFPTSKLSLVLFKLIPVTSTVFDDTFTVQVAVFPPAVAVIVVVPTPTATTAPLLSTVAIFDELLVHVIVLFVALDGVTVACSVALSPSIIDKLLLFKLILFTPITIDSLLSVTVSLHLASFPLCVMAVMVALPVPTPFTNPFESTIATFVFELVHVTVLFVALFGVSIATS